jgi:PIN domain nuclease of toxin-antitoxin system
MTAKFVLDTHAIVWYLEANPKLGNAAKKILDETDDELIIPLIALAEAAFIVTQGKTSIPTASQLVAALNADPRVRIVPLSYPIFEISLSLKGIPEMHDAFIVATAVWLRNQGFDVALLTKDREIVKSSEVDVIWR